MKHMLILAHSRRNVEDIMKKFTTNWVLEVKTRDLASFFISEMLDDIEFERAKVKQNIVGAVAVQRGSVYQIGLVREVLEEAN